MGQRIVKERKKKKKDTSCWFLSLCDCTQGRKALSTDAIDQCRLKVAVITAVDDQGSVWSTLLRTAFKMSTKKTTQKQVRALSGTVAELWNSLLLPSKDSGSELVIRKVLQTPLLRSRESR